jgi:hypothetical protein
MTRSLETLPTYSAPARDMREMHKRMSALCAWRATNARSKKDRADFEDAAKRYAAKAEGR